MPFLPIVERELRVAARRKSTYRIRVWTTLAALVVSLFFMLIASMGGRMGISLGPVLHGLLTYYAFGLSLLAGVFFASDCLSEEKREGTLGLLFLTDLKGYDVVLGKLASVGLSALYGLVAILPVTGLPLLMGGVTVGEFWRVSLALGNVLFFALAAGIMVSAWSREAVKAMSNTFVLLIVAVVGLPVLASVLVYFAVSGGWYYAAMSPFQAFTSGREMAFVYDPRKYWISLGVSNFAAWLMLVIAAWSLPRAWQDRPVKTRKRRFTETFANKSPAADEARRARRAAERGRLLEANPVLWLGASNESAAWRSMRFRTWLLTIAGSIIVVGTVVAFDGAPSQFITWPFSIIFKLLVAVQACRFFVESRQRGAMDLLLSTPLTGAEMIRGQWMALRRLFFWPIMVFILAQLTAMSFEMANADNKSGMMSLMGPRPSAIFLFFLIGNGSPVMAILLSKVYAMAIFLMDFFAVCWMGMWLALSLKNPRFAAPLTVLFVLVLPSILYCLPVDLFADLFFILYARSRLMGDFRATALPEYRTRYVYRPPTPPRAQPPPLPPRIPPLVGN